MSLLIEGISVVIRRTAIEEKYPGGFDGFKASVPNKTFCADDDLARVGFMAPVDVKSFCESLEGHGLTYLIDGIAHDIVVIDQQRGPLVPCEWVEVWDGYLEKEKIRKITICAMTKEIDGMFQGPEGTEWAAEPDGWEWEGSLSQTFGFSPTEEIEKSLTFLRHEDGLDVYFNELTGKESYVGRISTVATESEKD